VRDLLEDAIDARQARTLSAFGPWILDPDDIYTDPDLCECGEVGEHDCDPATVRMDALDMHPFDSEVSR